jgi:hypothetical protein
MSMPHDPNTAPGDPLAQQQQQAPRHQEQQQSFPADQPYPQQQPGYQWSGSPVPPAYAQPYPSYVDPPAHQADTRGSRRGQHSFPEDAARFARQQLRMLETKEIFRSSEFLLTVFGAFVLVVAAAIQRTFNAPQMWRLFTALFVAYILSRGIAKAGSNKGEPGNRA